MKHKCPICKKATDSETDAEFPFCSEKCRERDFGNWATEKYVVSEPIFTEDDSEEGDRKTVILDLDSPDRDEAGH
ncbi:MAG: DNA gyrase inhibitor YacG [Acidobacteriota bacterium]|nr:DNA gyrase inhibitor YacG [Acidobacteriota bacterium]